MLLFSNISTLAITSWLWPLAIITLLYLIVWIFREPFNGTLLICLTIPIIMPIVGNATGTDFWTIRLHHMFTVITFCALLAAILRRKYQGFAKTILVIPFGLYCFANVLSLFNTPYVENSIRQFMKLLGANVAMYIVVTTTLNNRERLERVVKILLGVGLILALIGIIQNVAYRFLSIDLFLNIKNAPSASAAAFAERGWFPQYITFLLCIALPLYFSKAHSKWKPWLAFCMCVYGIVIASGLSRSSYVVAVVIILTAWVLKVGREMSRYLIRIAFISILALVLASLIPSFFEKDWQFVYIRNQGEMFSLDEPSNAIRVDLATETLKHIKAHPLIGKGFGSWGRIVPPKIGRGGGCQGGSAFNVFLGVLYDGGAIGLIAFGLICFLYLKSCFGLLKIVKDPYHKTILYIAILVFVDIMVTAQFHPTWLAGYAWLAIAMGMSICNIVKGEMANENRLCSA